MNTSWNFLADFPWLTVSNWLIWAFLLGNLMTGPLQHLFIFRPRRLPKDHSFSFPVHFEEHWIHTPHRGRLNALFFPLSGKAKGTILFFHGNGSNLDRWGWTYKTLQSLGYNLFIYDYRGYGKSTGPRNQEIMYRDAEAVFRWFSAYRPHDPIVLYGRSMGSTFASRVASRYPCEMLLLETPFSSMKDLFYSYYPFLPRLFFFKYRFPTRRYLSRVDVPVAIFQGTRDRIVPYRNARKLVGLLKEGDHFVRVEGGGHNDLVEYESFRLALKATLERG